MIKRGKLSKAELEKERVIADLLYPDFPKRQEYDVILIDPPWKYEHHT